MSKTSLVFILFSLFFIVECGKNDQSNFNKFLCSLGSKLCDKEDPDPPSKSSRNLSNLVPGNNTLIVGGVASQDRIPYQVSLRDEIKGHFCGASILTAKWILTAAHCTYQQNADKINAVVGSNFLDHGGDFYSICRIIVHENYNSTLVKNDISIIEVSEEIQFNNDVQPIQLPNKSPKGGDILLLTGWGKTSFPGELPIELQAQNVTVLKMSKCNWTYVDDTQVCTLNQYGEGACEGDSGGPLTQGLVQYALVSYGKPCARGSADVHTNIFAFKDWLLRNIKS